MASNTFIFIALVFAVSAHAQSCPASSTASSCYNGIMGPSAAVAAIVAADVANGASAKPSPPVTQTMTSGTVCYTQSSTCALLAQVMTPVTASNCPVGSNVTWYGQFGSVSGCNSNLPIMLNGNAANPYPQLGTPVISVCASQNCNLPPGMSSSSNTASSSSSATCPSAGSSSSISCYGGATFSGTLPSGGLCTCKCGASASVADYDYIGGSGSSNSDSTQFMAASTAACSNTVC